MKTVKMINLIIDGRDVEVEPGQTILKAAGKAGVRIPTLCYHPDLEPYGGCRLCIVKVEGMRGMPPACITQVAEGMQVTTEDEEILQTRKMVMRLLLADHPSDCLNCRANLDCELQKLAQELGVREHGMVPVEREGTIDESNPVFDRDMNRCVLCARCVKTCNEILGLGAIDFTRRGHQTEVGPFLGGEIVKSICESCGECVVHCPTGALYYRDVPPQVEREVKVICPYCGTGCGILLGVRKDKIVSARGDRQNPVNRGSLCVKGRFGSYQYVNDERRLSKPLVRKAGKLEESTWEEALGLVARKFGEYKGDAFAAFSSAKVANEDNYLLQKLTRAVQRSNNIDHCARL